MYWVGSLVGRHQLLWPFFKSSLDAIWYFMIFYENRLYFYCYLVYYSPSLSYSTYIILPIPIHCNFRPHNFSLYPFQSKYVISPVGIKLEEKSCRDKTCLCHHIGGSETLFENWNLQDNTYVGGNTTKNFSLGEYCHPCCLQLCTWPHPIFCSSLLFRTGEHLIFDRTGPTFSLITDLIIILLGMSYPVTLSNTT